MTKMFILFFLYIALIVSLYFGIMAFVYPEGEPVKSSKPTVEFTDVKDTSEKEPATFTVQDANVLDNNEPVQAVFQDIQTN